MIIQTFACGPCHTNTYIVGCANSQKACMIDAPPDCLSFCRSTCASHQWSLQAIFLTHTHFDHIGSAGCVRNALGGKIYVHPFDAPNLEKPGSDQLPTFGIEGVVPDCVYQEGDVIAVGSLQFHVLHTPGHTPGGVCLYLPEQKVLFSGDTLFAGAMGRVDFPTSQEKQMGNSLRRLALLPEDVRVFPGHGSSTTIGQERWIAHV